MALVAGSRAEVTVNVNGTEESRRQIETVGGALSQMGGKVSALHGTLGALGVLAAATAFAGWIKGAIDATDAASDLSQKTGIAIEDLAGLELAYQMGGMEADALAGSQTKLSKAIVEGNAGLEKLGINAKNLDGSLKSNKAVLYSVADSFAAMEDGAQKTALAMTIFGKSGADMIPMLNGGSAGLREMDEMAAKLGLRLSKETVDQAGQFNDTLDLMMLGSQGIARGIAAELLPTLSSLAGSFLTTMMEGDRLKNTAQFLANVFKILYTVGVGVVEVFSTAGKTLGAAGAQLVALMNGDFKEAAQIGREWASDIGKDWSGTAKAISDAWNTSGNTVVDAQAKMLGAQKKLEEERKKKEARAKLAAKEAATEMSAEAKTLAELAGLTGGFASEWDQLSKLYGKGRISIEDLTKAQADLLAKQPAVKKAADDTAKATADYTKATDAARDALESDIEAIQEQARALESKVATYGLLPDAITAVQIAELEASKQSLALTDVGIADIQRRIDALQQLKRAQVTSQQQEAGAEGAKKLAEDGKRAADSIQDSLTDALMRGFESGNGFAKNLATTVKNMFKTMVLRPVVSAIVNPIAGAVTGALGMPGVAQAAASAVGGGSSVLGNGLSLASIGSSLAAGGGMASSLGTGFVGSVYGGMTGAGVGSGLTSSAGLALGQGLGTMGSALMAAAPYLAAVVAAVAIWKKLDTSGTYHTGGAASATSAGVTSVSAGSLNMERIQSNTATQQMVGQLAQGVVGILDSTALAFGKTAGYQAATAFADDTSKDGAWGSLVISKMGQSIVNWQDTRGNGKWSQKTFADGDKGQEQYLAALTSSVRTALDSIGLPAWAKTMINGVASDATLEDLAKVVQQINGTQAALASMRAQLVGFSSLTDGAVSALMAAADGIDSLFASASAYYDAFYTEAEKNAAATQQIAKALAAVNLQMPTSEKGYRALVEAQLALGAQGAESVSVLLANAAAFAQITPEVEAVTKDLSSYRSALTDAYNTEADALQSATSRLGSFATSLRELNKSALLGNLSPLSAQEKYAEAARQFDATLAAARADDPRAQADFEGARIAFLEASRAVNASSMQYQQDFVYAQTVTEDAARWAEASVAGSEAQLAVLKAQVSSLIDINKSVLSVREALLQYNQAMNGSTGSLTTMPQPVSVAIPYYPSEGRTNNAAHEIAIAGGLAGVRAELAGLRGDQRVQTGDIIQAQHGSADESAKRISGSFKAASYREERVHPE